MQNKIILTIATILLTSCTIVYAITIGIEPPASYINNLKTCTKSSITTKNGIISEYTIKGKSPYGRCEVYMSMDMNCPDPKECEGFKSLYSDDYEHFWDFREKQNPSKKDNLSKKEEPSLESLINQSREKKEKLKGKVERVCKFNNQEIKSLIDAYQKHDGRNLPPKTDKDGALISFSINSHKMSSYDRLIMKMSFSPGPCKDPKEKSKTYSCEYADATCYVELDDKEVSSIKCPRFHLSSEQWYKIEKHVKTGKCQQIF